MHLGPTRFLDTDEDRLETRLLGAALDDAPPSGALRRAEVALGFGVSAGIVATTAATSTAKAATAHLGAAQTVAQAGVASVAKWLGIGLVSSAVVTGGLHYGVTAVLSTSVAPPSTPRTEAPAQNRKPSPRTALRRKAVEAPIAEQATLDEPADPLLPPTENDEPRAEPELVAPVPSPRPPSASALKSHLGAIQTEPEDHTRVPSLSVELSILERARHALLEHRPDVVLREVDAYTRARTTGVFDAEAEMLSIEASLQQGNVGFARARATASLERAPGGPHAARLREIIASQQP